MEKHGMKASARHERLNGQATCCRRGPQFKNACFAVVRFQGRVHVKQAVGTAQRLRDVEGVYQVRLDAARHTIHILYNGDPRAIHRVCTCVCETGLDVIAHMAAHGLPLASEPRDLHAMRGGA
jgi:hypothetical protein